MNKQNQTNYSALTTLTMVFFFWGFIAAGNSIFIPFCKHKFELDQFQSQLIDFAFYLAYFIGALGLFVVGTKKGHDIVGKWGYKRSIINGLVFSAMGASAMIVSVYLNSFVGMLMGLFIVALGFSLQQTSANPFMISLGDPKTGANRINLGGSINSLGTTLGPIIIALALFGSAKEVSDEMINSLGLTKVNLLYACVGSLFLIVALVFKYSKKLPDGINLEVPEKANKASLSLITITILLAVCFTPVFYSYLSDEQKNIESLEKENDEIYKNIEDIYDISPFPISSDFPEERKADIKQFVKNYIPPFILDLNQIESNEAVIKSLSKPLEKKRMMWLFCGLLVVVIGIITSYILGRSDSSGWGAMQYPQLALGMLAIFVYVGVEVAIGSNLGELLKQEEFGGYSASKIAPFIAMFWGSLMIGRWVGAVNVFPLGKTSKIALKFIVPFVAFSIILGATQLAGYDVSELYWYIVCILIQIAAFLATKDKPALTLSVFGTLGVISIIVALNTTGIVAVYAILSGGLACSIMWPCIFSLATAGLGKYTSQGAGFLVMMILGGAIIPPIQGKLSDLETVGIQNSFIIGGVCFAYLVFYAILAKNSLRKQGLDFE
ncbi:MAG: MFS transporter [Crocinitomicaceae bacterium]|nr:MFS transporter [Crocinitomicaceae bacterium]|tara:strand:+ start:1295 stop:3118 length:1824 start_codon:yes stop_codon:yes gene_type:complete